MKYARGDCNPTCSTYQCPSGGHCSGLLSRRERNTVHRIAALDPCSRSRNAVGTPQNSQCRRCGYWIQTYLRTPLGYAQGNWLNHHSRFLACVRQRFPALAPCSIGELTGCYNHVVPRIFPERCRSSP